MNRQTVSTHQVSVLLLEEQNACLAGPPAVSGQPAANVYRDGAVVDAFLVDDTQDLPRVLAPADPQLASYDHIACFTFGFRPDEIGPALAQVQRFADDVRAWSLGTHVLQVTVKRLRGAFLPSRWGGAFWTSWPTLEAAAQSYVTPGTDATIGLASVHDVSDGRYVDVPACGLTYGWDFGLGGAGYSWVPNTANPGFWFNCLNDAVLAHEWAHQVTSAVRGSLLGFHSIYPDPARFPANRGYPACGRGAADHFAWFPDSHESSIDPDAVWCGASSTEVRPDTGHQLLEHFDVTLRHYPLGRFTGNHCDDGVLDDGEWAVDRGGRCPAIPALTVGLEGSTVREGAGGTTTGAPLRVLLTSPAPYAMEVRLRSESRTAVSETDFVPLDTTVVVPAGATQATSHVVVRGDGQREPDEVLGVRITWVTGAPIVGGSATVTIRNDD